MIGTQISRYKILSELGRGGMGVVYKALDTRLVRPVALKFIPPDRKKSTIIQRRLIQEAQAASALNHPNILTIFDIDEYEGKNYIVMEFIDGQSLEERLDEGPMDENEVIRIASEIASGLRAAHVSGIIHRDIKPANVMMTLDGRVKIMDFGLAKVAENSSLTAEGGILGTAAYMSPEQARGEEVDPRTDLWSLGVVLYEMISGVRPFQGAYLPALVYAVMNLDPDPLPSKENNISESLSELTIRCLEKDRELRYASALDILTDLVSIGGGIRPIIISAGPPKSRRKKAESLKQRSSDSISRVVTNRKARTGFYVLVITIMAAFFLTSKYNPWAETAPRQPIVALLPIESTSSEYSDSIFLTGLQYDIVRQLEGFQNPERGHSALSPEEVSRRHVTESSWSDILPTGSVVIKGSIQSIGSSIQLTFFQIQKDGEISDESITLIASATDLLPFQNRAGLELAKWITPSSETGIASTASPHATSISEAYSSYLEGKGYLAVARSVREVTAGINRLEEALRLDASFSLAHIGLGEAYLLYSDFDDNISWVDRAERSAEQAAELSTEVFSLHELKGRIEMHRSDAGSALNLFSRAAVINPGSPSIHRHLGEVYSALDRFSEAEEHYQAVIELRPKDWKGYFDLGRFYESTNRVEDAAEQYLASARADGNQYLPIFSLAAVQEFSGDTSGAIQSYEKAAILDEASSSHMKLADLHFYDLLDPAASAFYLEQAIERDGLDFRVWNLLADVYFSIPGEQKNAVNAWIRSAELARVVLIMNGDDPEALGALALALVRQNKKEEALEKIELLKHLPIQDANSAFDLAKLMEATDSRDSSLVYINQSIDLGLDLKYVLHSPWLSALVSDPRFSGSANPSP